MRTHLTIARKTLAALFAAGTLVAAAACTATPITSEPAKTPVSDSGGGTSGEDGGTAVTKPFAAAPGQLAIFVKQVRQHRTADKADALEIAMTLANGDGGQAVVLNPTNFRLKVASGLLKVPTLGGVAKYVQGKSSNLTDSLSGGASFGPWTLSFDVDTKVDAPVELLFEVPGVTSGTTTIGDGRKAVAAVVLEACTLCGASCTYLDLDDQNCGACNVRAAGKCSGATLACDSGAATTLCKTSSSLYCADVSKDSRNCGTCGQSAPSGGSCVNGAPACPTGSLNCSSGCTDVRWNNVQCGACGNDCAARKPTATSTAIVYSSTQCGDSSRSPAQVGMCQFRYTVKKTFLGNSCTTLCADVGLSCLGARTQSPVTFPNCDVILDTVAAGSNGIDCICTP